MKQTVFVKKLRIVPAPITQYLNTVPDGVNLPFSAYVPIVEQMQAFGKRAALSSAELTLNDRQDNTGGPKETQETDVLLALVETLKSDDISEPDIPIGTVVEVRVVKGAHEDNPDPLLALLGTLEANVTDIGERHDDYIGDALLTEGQGDNSE